MSDGPLLGAIEAGGTKFVCAVGTGPGDIQHRDRFDTTDPATTLGEVIEFFRARSPVAAIGVASFGPIELRREHPAYGHITHTPKPGWSNTDVVGPLERAFSVPVGFDTDVNGAALGEWTHGAGQGLRNLVYVTVGTGIGGGCLIDGRPVTGLVHPEMGHVTVARHPGDDFEGNCPYHGDCMEGMTSGPAIEARWGGRGETLSARSEVVDMVAHYLASGLRQIVYVLSPERIILGGGVSTMAGLIEKVERSLGETMNGYARHTEHERGFVVPPGLAGDAGIAGAFLLAARALGM